MEDYKNIRISVEADSIIEKIHQKFGFTTKLSVMRFSLAYALRDFRDEIDFEALDRLYEKNGTNLNVGTVDDQDMVLRTLIKTLFPLCETPYKYARVAIIYGLYKIRELMDADDSFVITSLM